MKAGRILIVAAVSCTIGLLGEFRVGNFDGQAPRISFGVSEAQAAPRCPPHSSPHDTADGASSV